MNLSYCSECDKSRVLYAARKLYFDDVVKLKLKPEILLYTCGCSLQELGPDDAVMSRVYVHAKLSCSDPNKFHTTHQAHSHMFASTVVYQVT